MDTFTILAEGQTETAASVRGGQVVIAAAALVDVLGWELKPEGLCRDEVCVPVDDRSTLEQPEGLDLTAVADALGRPTLVDSEAATMVVGAPSASRQAALRDRLAPDFTLTDLEGVPKTLAGWTGKKRLLVAFSSW